MTKAEKAIYDAAIAAAAATPNAATVVASKVVKNPVLAQAFNRVQSTGDGDFEVIAKFGEMVADEWGLGFSKKNLASEKRVTVLMYDESGQPPLQISCSTGLSAEVRKALADGNSKEEVLGALLLMSVVENQDGIKFLTMSAGEKTTVKDIKKEFVPFDGLVALA